MDCKAYDDRLADLARGADDAEASLHTAACEGCAERLQAYRRMFAASRLPQASARESVLARIEAMMPRTRRRLVARLLGNGLAAAGARSDAKDFSLHLGADDLSIRLYYAPLRKGWEILGLAPAEGWTAVCGGTETPCDEDGEFRIVVPDLGVPFTLCGPGLEVEVPSARELTGRGV